MRRNLLAPVIIVLMTSVPLGVILSLKVAPGDYYSILLVSAIWGLFSGLLAVVILDHFKK